MSGILFPNPDFKKNVVKNIWGFTKEISYIFSHKNSLDGEYFWTIYINKSSLARKGKTQYILSKAYKIQHVNISYANQ